MRMLVQADVQFDVARLLDAMAAEGLFANEACQHKGEGPATLQQCSPSTPDFDTPQLLTAHGSLSSPQGHTSTEAAAVADEPALTAAQGASDMDVAAAAAAAAEAAVAAAAAAAAGGAAGGQQMFGPQEGQALDAHAMHLGQSHSTGMGLASTSSQGGVGSSACGTRAGGSAVASDGAVRSRGRSSLFRGVTKHRRSGRWEAHIWIKEIGKQVYLGGYQSEDHAAEVSHVVVRCSQHVCKECAMLLQPNILLRTQAYDVATLKVKGKSGKAIKTNFPPR
eukprot:357859-Chlamydomonas_euryale.AAC.18